MPQQNPLAVTSASGTKSNAQSQLKVDPQGASLIAGRHGQNYEAAYAGAAGMAANPTGVTTSAGLATTYLGICLSNPAGSGKNLSVLDIAATINVAPAALTFLGLITGYSAAGVVAHTTALTVQNALIGVTAAALVGLVDSACTLVGTPVWSRFMAETPSATGVVGFSFNPQGLIVIPPGGYLAIGTSIAGPASGFFGSIWWEENPV